MICIFRAIRGHKWGALIKVSGKLSWPNKCYIHTNQHCHGRFNSLLFIKPMAVWKWKQFVVMATNYWQLHLCKQASNCNKDNKIRKWSVRSKPLQTVGHGLTETSWHETIFHCRAIIITKSGEYCEFLWFTLSITSWYRIKDKHDTRISIPTVHRNVHKI